MPEKTFTPRELFVKTLPFVWAKLIVQAIALVVGGLLIWGGIFLLSRNTAMGLVTLIFIVIGASVYMLIVRYMGYLIKAGHIAVLTEAVTTGVIPDNQVEYGKNKVKERFATSSVFFVLDKLIRGAVKQVQKGLTKLVGGIAGAVPQLGPLVNFANALIGTVLGYVDECVIGWIFHNDKEQSAWKGAADGVVIYFQNWKKILGNAAITVAITWVITFVVGYIISMIFGAIMPSVSGLGGFAVLILGLLVAFSLKAAFIDSYVLVRMLHTFMTVAPTTEIKFDLYNKLSGMSRSFKNIFSKIPKDEVSNAAASSAAPPAAAAAPAFCGECGAKAAPNEKFCGECGKPVV